jgi:dihydrodipicolinate synthase/N-acetylneuraminate lyase
METLAALRARLGAGLVIPAHPLALDAQRKLDERRQRALSRYYAEAGAGGMAVAVHATQFAIRNPQIGLFRPVLELAMEEARRFAGRGGRELVMIGGICGRTAQACAEAATLRDLGYDAGLLSLGALADATEPELIAHARTVAEVVPLIGFYLQPAVGGRLLSQCFWREFVTINNVVAIKVAPFNRYQTLDVVRAVAESGRAGGIALYTGNDDNIVADLMADLRFHGIHLRFAGGLLGHWAAWTRRAVELLERIHAWKRGECPADGLFALGGEITDANAALFDAPNGFRGCVAGIHEILRRQGLLAGRWCLDPDEDVSPAQMAEIDRVCRAYPHLNDNEFVAANLERWLQ